MIDYRPYLTVLCPTLATTEVRNVVPKGTGIQDPSGRVSPTKVGLVPVQGCAEENVLTRN